jgi:hypothetical protein
MYSSNGKLNGAIPAKVGGQGGAANNLTVNVDTSSLNQKNFLIATSSPDTSSINISSVGGTGGEGGWASSGEGGGADGGKGGSGGTITLTTSVSEGVVPLISTTGANSTAIYAVSQGGIGGKGGKSSSPGRGGVGGDPGSVNITNNYSIQTTGANSNGIWAQSQGSKGGNGGSESSIFGGSGGSAGHGSNGGLVTITNNASITTNTAMSYGIFAQSAGGLGGDGGSAFGLVSFGSTGNTGGDGGAVIVKNSGIISVTSAKQDNPFSYAAIYAQSIGGGGGAGGNAIGFVGFGASGGQGGSGGQVTVENSGALNTKGPNVFGLFAQSVGGGGGTAGNAVSWIGNAGGGGPASNGGTVTVTNKGDITGSGEGSNSTALFAQSIGGGGGDGGIVVGGLLSIGGRGGPGGNGGDVTVTNTGNLTSIGDHSLGLTAQSVGGGGGSGGLAVSVGLGIPLAIAIGGTGGNGGNGGKVCVNCLPSEPNNQTAINTNGANSTGVDAESIGGGGGRGGGTIAVTTPSPIPVGSAFSFGGQGGGGGSGGEVNVSTRGSITTAGFTSPGIYAKSIGGGGGSGGYAIDFTAAASGTLNLAFGGTGGSGGAANTVEVSNWALIKTNGQYSSAIEALSIGGGGGGGGFSIAGSVSDVGINVSLAGKGGIGSNAGNVEVTNNGILETGVKKLILVNDNFLQDTQISAHSSGIYASSVGGGGGKGGFSIAAGVGATGELGVALGGTGGIGSYSGNVTVINSGKIKTYGDFSDGITATSIGGGGGGGGFAIGAGFGGSGAINFSAGGGCKDGCQTGGDGGLVKVTSSGDEISTFGNDSNGINAQSTGGGGGDGGFSIAAGASFKSGVNANISLGGKGGNGGTANQVIVENTTALIQTVGNNSNGILAESAGGGGGNGGFSVAGALSFGENLNADVSIGGKGGAGATSNTVKVNSAGDIKTSGNNSKGIYAHSVGGGGGNGGISIAGSGSVGDKASANVTIGGSGGDGDTSGIVEITSKGKIITSGNFSSGIDAKSIGGGGGNGGLSIAGSISNSSTISSSVAIGGKGVKGATAKNVTVSTCGLAKNQICTKQNTNLLIPTSNEIQTNGLQSYGIIAESIGGGGGVGGAAIAASLVINKSLLGAKSILVGGNGASGGDGGSGSNGAIVEVNNYQNITTLGAQSAGILAKSVGGGGGNGGYAISGSIGGSGEIGGSINVAVGGNGGNGGDGEKVTVNGFGTINTSGNNSDAIEAASVGGGGGNAGFAIAAGLATSPDIEVSVSVGGKGGIGGNGSEVIVNQGNRDANNKVSSYILTQGDFSDGISATSVGKGGGKGGGSIAGSMSYFSQSTSMKASVSVGGKGGGGGTGDKVTVENYSNITTKGNKSSAISAKSIGGGGGNGGLSISGSLTGGLSKTADVSVGGSGGDGGTAGDVKVTNYGNISTGFAKPTTQYAVSNDILISQAGYIYSGRSSVGIDAQSIGGGGGDGGMSVAANLSVTKVTGGTCEKTNASGCDLNVNVSVGGGGGNGNTAGNTSVINSGSISTLGDDASGIIAKSIGGGGGQGGLSFSGILNFSTSKQNNPTTIGINVSVGGGGGDGNTSGKVTVENSGNITTNGAHSHGIIAESIGGGGGSGGNANSMSLQLVAGCTQTSILGNIAQRWEKIKDSCQEGATNPSYNANVNVGGDAGNGNTSEEVSVTNSGHIITTGNTSVGILARSVAGGGGNGGQAMIGLTGLLDLGLGDTAITAVGFATNASSSLSMPFQVTVGGAGGSGNNAAKVTVINHGSIETSGGFAYGIEAQSIGHGGGNGGQANSGKTGMVSVGGSGGDQGDGAEVIVANYGMISTHGISSDAIMAQSIGGGGGNAGGSLSGISGAAGGGAGIFSVGGKTKGGGNGNQVIVTSRGQLTTQGNYANGITAQSIGGGGGNGGTNTNGVISIGASDGGNGGNGAKVTIDNSALINTTGKFSFGIEAQSIGGGGGNLTADNFNLPGLGDLGTTSKTTIGGASGLGGNGGIIDVTNSGNISSTSTAILGQSLGGGGGINFNFLKTKKDIQFGEAADLNNPISGSSSAITINNSGMINVENPNSIGIIGQSISGGGGLVFTETVSLGKIDANAGQTKDNLSSNAGAVTINNSKSIIMNSANSVGVFAQSIGGLGGTIISDQNNANYMGGHLAAIQSIVVKATTIVPQPQTPGSPPAPLIQVSNNSGNVTVANLDKISAAGLNSTGIILQSVASGQDSNGHPSGTAGSLQVTNGSAENKTAQIIGGTGNGVAVALIDGSSSKVTNYGSISSAGRDGIAIYSNLGNATVVNFGTINGQIKLGGDSATNHIISETGSTWNVSGPFEGSVTNNGLINLNSGNDATTTITGSIVNNGVARLSSPGGQVATTVIDGNFTTSNTGILAVKTDLDPVADQLIVTGTADLAGVVSVNLTNTGAAMPGAFSKTIVHAGGGLNNNGLQLQAPSTAVISYSLSTTTTDAILSYVVNFAPFGMTKNQNALGNGINGIQFIQQNGVYPAFLPVASLLLYQPTVWGLGQAYNSLSGEGVTASQQTNFSSNDAFMSSAMTQSNLWLMDRDNASPNSVVLYDDEVQKTPEEARSKYIYKGIGRLRPRIAQRTWSAWFSGNGGAFSYSGDYSNLGTASVKLGGAGFSGGIDYQLTPNALVGVTSGYGRYGFGVSDRQTSGNVYGGHIASYAALRSGGLYGRGVLGMDFFTNSERRTINIPGVTPAANADGTTVAPIPGIYDTPTGQFGSYSVSGRFETGYRKNFGLVDLAPFAAIQFSSLRSAGFNENSIYGLNYLGRHALSLPSFVGSQIDTRFVLSDSTFIGTWIRAAWKHEFDTDRSVGTDFLAAPDVHFGIFGAKVPRDMARINAGLELGIAKNLTFFSVFNTDLAPKGQSFGGSGGVRMIW